MERNEAKKKLLDSYGLKEDNPMDLLTDTNAQAKQYSKKQPFFYDKSRIWWLWNSEEFYWEVVDEIDILNMIQDSTGADTISQGTKNKILNALKQNGRRNLPKSIKPTWIQFKNKIYDIETEEIFDASPEYFVTNPIPWKASSDASTPIMDKIFTEWVGKEYVDTLYEVLSYCLIPDYPIHRIFCFIGEGMNGKSKFLELLRRFIGGSNCCSTELDTLLQSRFEVTRLHKKLVCQMGETNFNEMSKTSIIKKLSGGDLIGYEYKNKDPFEEKNYAKILIATNNLPTTTDKTIGFYRRWLILDFPNRFTEKKDILAEIPDEEYNNLATKCMFKLKELLVKRSFHNEGDVEARMERYEFKSNFLETFINSSTRNEGDGYITNRDFFNKFCSWSLDNKHRKMSEVAVAKAMKKLGYETSKRYFNWMFDGKGGQTRVWGGISWDL